MGNNFCCRYKSPNEGAQAIVQTEHLRMQIQRVSEQLCTKTQVIPTLNTQMNEWQFFVSYLLKSKGVDRSRVCNQRYGQLSFAGFKYYKNSIAFLYNEDPLLFIPQKDIASVRFYTQSPYYFFQIVTNGTFFSSNDDSQSAIERSSILENKKLDSLV